MVKKIKKSFSKQKGGQKKATLASFKKMLYEISGGDISYLLSSYFESKEGQKILEELNNKNLIFKNKLDKIIQNIKIAHFNCNQKEKIRFLSLISKEIKLKKLKKYGFSINKKSFSNSRKFFNKNGPGSKPILPESKKKLSTEIQNKIKDFYYSDFISRPSPDKMV